jgi:TatD DNase family protein
MTISIVDTHAHLDMAPFNTDREDVISRAKSAGVSTIITVGVDLDSSRQAIKLADSYSGVWATTGFHPHEASRVNKEQITELAKIADHPRVVAIGEIGLDFYRNRSPKEAQFQALKWQLELADRVSLPVIIHSRQADREMQTTLHHWLSSRKVEDQRPVGVIHCFNNDLDIAREYIDMGFYIAFGAYIGYPASQHLRTVISKIPSDRLLLETDCPFLPPQQHRGKRNEPSYLPLTLGVVVEARKTSPDQVALETKQNAYKLFNLPAS